jgi:hypothetical protein
VQSRPSLPNICIASFHPARYGEETQRRGEETLTAIELRTVHIHLRSDERVTSSIHEIANANYQQQQLTRRWLSISPKQKYPDTRDHHSALPINSLYLPELICAATCFHPRTHAKRKRTTNHAAPSRSAVTRVVVVHCPIPRPYLTCFRGQVIIRALGRCLLFCCYFCSCFLLSTRSRIQVPHRWVRILSQKYFVPELEASDV